MNKNISTLDKATEIIGASILKNPDNNDKIMTGNPTILNRKLSQFIVSCLERSEYSYDPTAGSINIVIPPHLGFRPLEKMIDGRLAGVHVREYFEEEGWESVVVLPSCVGVDRTIIRLNSPNINAMTLLSKNKTPKKK